jgi:putative membrane-bound dehydrogenase-like protein
MAAAQLPAEEELKCLRPADGIEIDLFAAEPMITNPAAIDVDTQGRVWVAEIQHYRRPAPDSPGDKIKVLEDTDGDGRADRVTVFAEGLFCPMSVCVAGSKVYVATSPDLWVYEDADGDLRADGPPLKLLTGFGGYNHDHGAHSLALGPDHKWWMSHGDGGFDVTGADGSRIQYEWGAMLRGELDGTKLERVAINFRNPYELCVSSFGDVFCSDNDNDGNQSARICWIVEGGDYGWFKHPPARPFPGTPYGEHWHFRGHVPGFVPATIVTGFGSPSGICFYEGNAFPQFTNAAFHADPGPREVRVYRHEPLGAGMKGAAEVILVSDGDDYFRPIDVCTAPDGTLFIGDWYDGGVGGHAYNNPNQGRVFRLRPSGAKVARREKPGPYESVDDAMVALASPNLATQFLARERLLAAPTESAPRLTQLLSTAEPTLKARALWVLDRIGIDRRTAIVEQLNSPDASFRALAVRILARHDEQYLPVILERANDTSWQVRREVLLAIRGNNSPDAWIALQQIALAAPPSDRYLAETIRIAAGSHTSKLFDAIAAAHAPIDYGQLLLALDAQRAIPLIAKALNSSSTSAEVRRTSLILLGAQPSLEAATAVWKVAIRDCAAADRHLALALTAHNLPADWNDLNRDESFRQGVVRLLQNPEFAIDALNLVAASKSNDFLRQVLDIAADPSCDLDVRTSAIATIGQLGQASAAPTLAQLLDEPNGRIRSAVLEVLVLLRAWGELVKYVAADATPPSDREQVLARLIETTGGAVAIRRLLERAEFPPMLRVQAIALASNHPDANIRALYDEFLPASERSQRLGVVLRPEAILALTGDANRGRQVFLRSSAAQCSKCHAIQGVGGTLGPDLSQIGRKYERAALLETILEPSKAIAPEFVSHVVETKDGQTYAGFITQRDDRQLVLKDANNRTTRIPVQRVETIEPQGKSLMPELVLQDVSAQDAADLLAYLSSLR